jgi:hypothetical protein
MPFFSTFSGNNWAGKVGRAVASIATTIGSTVNTVTPTLSSGITVGTTHGSPFGTSVNSYVITQPTSAPYRSVQVPGGSGFAFGTGDFTIEWFQYQSTSTSFGRIFWYGATPSLGVSLEGTAYFWPTVTGMGTTGSLLNSWVHFALVRQTGRIYLYRNGTLQSTAGGVVNTTNVTDTSSTFYIGSKANGGLASEQYIGSITNFRVCKGLAVYTGNFTTPTSALGQTASANPYGGANTSAITAGQCTLLLNP